MTARLLLCLILALAAGCGTVADQHDDFPEIPTWWQQ